MQKLLWILALVVLIGAPVEAQAPVRVTVNGQPVALDMAPVQQNGRILVPLRGVLQQLGATVTYDAASHGVLAQTESTTINLTVGSNSAVVNGRSVALETPPLTVGARVMVPLRFVSEALGATVTWDATQSLVAITAASPPPPSVTYVPPAPPLETARISRVVLDDSALPTHPLWLGSVLHITMYGTPGGHAQFDINGQTGLSLHETAAGVYQGHYMVRASDLNREAVVLCHLTLDDGQEATLAADDTVALDGRSSEGERNVALVHDRLIYSVIHNGPGTLTWGREFLVRMNGVPGGTAFFDLGDRRGIPMHEASPGQYVGSYMIHDDDNNPQARVVVHLALSDGEHASMTAAPTVAEYGWRHY